MKTCSNCGAQCGDDYIFCTVCGAKIETDQNGQNSQEPNRQPKEADNPLQAETAVNTSNQHEDEAQKPAQQPKADQISSQTQITEGIFNQPEPAFIKCEFCGELVRSDETACPKCGAQLKYSKQASIEAVTGEFIASKLKKIKKAGTKGIEKIKVAVSSVDDSKAKKWMDKYGKYIPAACALLVSVMILLIAVTWVASTPKLEAYGANELTYYSSDQETIIYNNRKIVARVNNPYDAPSFSMDHTKAAILSDFDGEDGGTLYYIDSAGKKEIDDSVLYYVMAASGNSVAYLTDYDPSDHTATLKLYRRKKTVIIRSKMDISHNDNANLVISPDGKAVAYQEYNDGAFAAYVSVNGREPKKLGKSKEIVAMSDKAKYIYYIDYDNDKNSGEFYVKSGNSKVKLAADADSLGELIFNKDCTQIVFHYEKKTYISSNAEDKIKLLNNRAYLLLPANTVWLSQDSNNTIYGINSFEDMLLISSEDIYYIDDNYELNKLTDICYKAAVSNDMSKLIYLDYSDTLHIVTQLDCNNPKDTELDADDIISFTVSEDGKTVYYINGDDELYSITASAKANKIADDVNQYNLVVLKNRMFFMVDYHDTGSLYYTSGKRKTAVKNADEVTYVYRLGNGLVYQESDYDERVIYGSKNGSSFKKLFTDD